MEQLSAPCSYQHSNHTANKKDQGHVMLFWSKSGIHGIAQPKMHEEALALATAFTISIL
jgi:hypothetical protein